MAKPLPNPLTPAPTALPADVTIDNWPLRDRPVETSLMLLGALLVAVLAGRLTGIGWWTPVFCLTLAASSWRMWLPVTFRIDHRGVEQRCLGHRRLIPWSAIAIWKRHPRGVMLFARRDEIPLDNLRGLYIDGRGQAFELWSTVEFYVQPRMGSTGTTISFAD